MIIYHLPGPEIARIRQNIENIKSALKQFTPATREEQQAKNSIFRNAMDISGSLDLYARLEPVPAETEEA